MASEKKRRKLSSIARKQRDAASQKLRLRDGDRRHRAQISRDGNKSESKPHNDGTST